MIDDDEPELWVLEDDDPVVDAPDASRPEPSAPLPSSVTSDDVAGDDWADTSWLDELAPTPSAATTPAPDDAGPGDAADDPLPSPNGTSTGRSIRANGSAPAFVDPPEQDLRAAAAPAAASDRRAERVDGTPVTGSSDHARRPRRPRPETANGDVAEFLRELSRLALDED